MSIFLELSLFLLVGIASTYLLNVLMNKAGQVTLPTPKDHLQFARIILFTTLKFVSVWTIVMFTLVFVATRLAPDYHRISAGLFLVPLVLWGYRNWEALTAIRETAPLEWKNLQLRPGQQFYFIGRKNSDSELKRMDNKSCDADAKNNR